MMPSLTCLRRRLEEATGPNFALDVAIHCELFSARDDARWWDFKACRPKGSPEPKPEEFWERYATNVTASVDAALELAQRTVGAQHVPEILRNALSTLGDKYAWHVNFPNTEQLTELPIEIVRAVVARLDLGEKEERA